MHTIQYNVFNISAYSSNINLTFPFLSVDWTNTQRCHEIYCALLPVLELPLLLKLDACILVSFYYLLLFSMWVNFNVWELRFPVWCCWRFKFSGMWWHVVMARQHVKGLYCFHLRHQAVQVPSEMLQATCPRRKCHIPEDLNLKIIISHFGFYPCFGILTTTFIIFNITFQKLELRNLFYHVTS